jgi:NADH pyrophosphatase NudC (nudix superfamily)
LHAQVLGPLRVVSGYQRRMEVFYLAHYTGGEIRVDGKEVLEAHFFGRDQLPDGLPREHHHLIAQAYAARQR